MEQEKRYWTRNGAEVQNDLGAHAGGLSGGQLDIEVGLAGLGEGALIDDFQAPGLRLGHKVVAQEISNDQGST